MSPFHAYILKKKKTHQNFRPKQTYSSFIMKMLDETPTNFNKTIKKISATPYKNLLKKNTSYHPLNTTTTNYSLTKRSTMSPFEKKLNKVKSEILSQNETSKESNTNSKSNIQPKKLILYKYNSNLNCHEPYYSPKKENNSSPKNEINYNPKKENNSNPKKENDSSPKKETDPSTKSQIASTVLDFCPVVSNVKSGIECITGKNYITGEKLSTLERVISGLSAIPGVNYLKAGKNVTKVSKIAKTVNKGNKMMKEEKIISKEIKTVQEIKRHGGFGQAKRSAGIPKSQQPDQIKYYEKTHYENIGKEKGEKTGCIREYIFKDKNNPDRVVIIREDLGHKYIENGKLVDSRGSHFHVEVHEKGKPTFNDKKHYDFDITKPIEGINNIKIKEDNDKNQQQTEKEDEDEE